MHRFPRPQALLSGALTPAVVLLVALGCRDNAASPTAPSAELAPPPAAAAAQAPTFSRVSTGFNHTCAVTTRALGNVAYCWGSNTEGKLGLGTTTGPETCPNGEPCSTRPARVIGALRFRLVSAGGNHTCGVTMGDVAYCWGWNYWGQLGDGTNSGRDTCDLGGPCTARPVRVAGGLRFRSVIAAPGHTCGVTTDDRAYCWGSNNSGQLGDGTQTNRQAPRRVAGGLRFRSLTLGGSEFTCGVTTDDRAYCWGDNRWGQLGIGTSDFGRLRPSAVHGGLAFAGLNAGNTHTCGFTTRGEAHCWGDNSFGELGIGTGTGPETCPLIFTDTPCSTVPLKVARGLAFVAVNGGESFTCGLTAGESAYCWGADGGQLGLGTHTGPENCPFGGPCSTRPARVVGGLTYRGVHAGGQHTCGLTTDRAAYCWGDNFWGQLGTGTGAGSTRPVAVAAPVATSATDPLTSAEASSGPATGGDESTH